MDRIIENLNHEIQRLTQARDLLLGNRRGRPSRIVGRRRKLSAEGRRKIAEAMRRRWAERRKQQAATKRPKAA